MSTEQNRRIFLVVVSAFVLFPISLIILARMRLVSVIEAGLFGLGLGVCVVILSIDNEFIGALLFSNIFAAFMLICFSFSDQDFGVLRSFLLRLCVAMAVLAIAIVWWGRAHVSSIDTVTFVIGVDVLDMIIGVNHAKWVASGLAFVGLLELVMSVNRLVNPSFR